MPAVENGTGDVRTVDGWDVADKLGSALPLLLLGTLLDGVAGEPATEVELLPAAELAVGDTEPALAVPTLVTLES